MSEPVVFRGLRNRTLADQQRAIADGYTSMYAYAIDELGGLLLDLTRRVEALEQNTVPSKIIDRGFPYVDDAGT